MTLAAASGGDTPGNREVAYGDDLALIHDAGFGHIARGAAITLLDRLGRQGRRDGRVVELACGSGISAQVLLAAGYEVQGFDLSPAMISLARERAPDGKFEVASLYDATLPECVAVTAIGEAFNYLFDERAGFTAMGKTIDRVRAALAPGGLFVFDFAEPGRARPRLEHHVFEGTGWSVVSEAIEHPERRMLERRIAARIDDSAGGARESRELHRLALYDREEVVALLRDGGWRVELLATYGQEYRFGLGHVGIVATAPTAD